METDIDRRVRQLAVELLDVPEAEITSATSPETIEAWDSLQHLNLMMALEDAFGVELAPDDFEQMANIGAIVALLEHRLS